VAARAPIDLDELIGHWTVLEDERVLVDGKRGATRLGFALLLKFYTGGANARWSSRAGVSSRPVKTPALSKEQRASRPASRVGRCSYSSL
jgi:hypothetical protein